MSNPTPFAGDPAAQQALLQLAQVKGQLETLTTLLTANHGALQQRINDLQTANDKRFEALEAHIAIVAQNERGTALRTAMIGAGSGGVAGIISAVASAALRLGHGS